MANAPDLKVKVKLITHDSGNNYLVQGDDNVDYKLYVSPKKTPPSDGDTILAYHSDKVPGTYNFFAVDDKRNAPKSSGDSGGSSGYWEEKFQYEVLERDPDIRHQRWTDVFLKSADIALRHDIPLVSGGGKVTSAQDIAAWAFNGAKDLIKSKDNA